MKKPGGYNHRALSFSFFDWYRSGYAGDEIIDHQNVVENSGGEDGGDGFHGSSPS